MRFENVAKLFDEIEVKLDQFRFTWRDIAVCDTAFYFIWVIARAICV